MARSAPGRASTFILLRRCAMGYSRESVRAMSASAFAASVLGRGDGDGIGELLAEAWMCACQAMLMAREQRIGDAMWWRGRAVRACEQIRRARKAR